MKEPPNQQTIIALWVEKAENNFIAAKQILTLTEECPYDAVCFHAKQSVEKYLKALLLHHKIDFPKSHDIGELIKLLPKNTNIPLTQNEQSRLTYYAVAGRYPIDHNNDLSADDAQKAIALAKKIKNHIETILQIKN